MRVLALAVSLMLSGACAVAQQPAPAVQPHLAAAPQSPATSPPAVQAPVPPLIGHVNDYAAVLNSRQLADLEKRLTEYEAQTTHQIAVLTVPSLQGESVESLSLRVVNTWKLGRKGLDNGVLITVAPKDRQARIDLGVGMSRVVSDAVVAKILNESMIPQFRAGQFGNGIERGVARLMEECRAYEVNP